MANNHYYKISKYLFRVPQGQQDDLVSLIFKALFLIINIPPQPLMGLTQPPWLLIAHLKNTFQNTDYLEHFYLFAFFSPGNNQNESMMSEVEAND